MVAAKGEFSGPIRVQGCDRASRRSLGRHGLGRLAAVLPEDEVDIRALLNLVVNSVHVIQAERGRS